MIPEKVLNAYLADIRDQIEAITGVRDAECTHIGDGVILFEAVVEQPTQDARGRWRVQ